MHELILYMIIFQIKTSTLRQISLNMRTFNIWIINIKYIKKIIYIYFDSY